MIPSAALQPVGKKDKAGAANTAANDDPNIKTANVRVLKADGQVVDQTVTTGINNRVNVQILSGLKEGDEVILGEESPEKGGKGGGAF